VLDKLLGQTSEVNGDATSAGDGPDKKGDLPKVTAAQIVTPYDDGIPGNPVGALQELCMARRWPPPLYELVNEKGLPHERSFVMCCTVIKTKERGDAKSKKLAKRQAAYKMLQQLKDLPIKPEPANLFEDEEEDRYASLRDAKVPTLTPDISQKVGQFHRNLKNSTGKHLEALQDTALNKPDLNYMQLLQEIALEQNFEVTYVDIEELGYSGKYQCLVQLSTLPVAVCYGSGATVNEAQVGAAHNALEYLKIMTRK
jgi:RISC-loading complex subunit TARBP2